MYVVCGLFSKAFEYLFYFLFIIPKNEQTVRLSGPPEKKKTKICHLGADII